MFRTKGYTNVANLLGKFRFYSLDEQLQNDVMDRVKTWIHGMEINRDRRQDPANITLIRPDPEDAKVAVSDDAALGKVDFWCRSRAENFISAQELFLVGASQEVTLIDSYIMLREISVARTAPRYAYLSEPNLSVQANQVLQRIEALKAAAPILDTFLLSLSPGQAKRIKDYIGRETTAKSLVPFDGMVLAVTDEVVPSRETMRSILGVREPESVESVRGPGRPRKVELVAEAFSQRFPQGRGAYTWGEVIRILEVEHEIFVGEDTLRKAVQLLGEAD